MCSYCGCEALVPIGRFMAEHGSIIDALGELERACALGGPARIRAADQLAAWLDPHTHAEEVGLFAVLGRQEEFTDHVSRLCAEHASLDADLARIRAGDISGLEEFVVALRDHIDREENGLFPAAAIALDGPGWEEVVALTPPAHPLAEPATE